LGEIEAALACLPGVRSAAVVLREGGTGSPRLLAYATGERLDPHTLRKRLRSQLPEHMVPTVIAVLPELPLLPSGKLDRRALPEVTSLVGESSATAAPEGATEIALAALWSEVLGLESIGRESHFFE